MAVRVAIVLAGFLFLVVGHSVSVQGQTSEAIPTPPPSSPAPAPAPSSTPATVPPNATYTPLDAGRDAYARGEAERSSALDRQLRVENDVRWFNSWAGPFGGTTRVEVRTPSSPWLGSRAYRIPSPYEYPSAVLPPPLFTPWPLVSGGIWGYPYYPWASQPIGHERIWTSPNGYIYGPRYAEPSPAGPQPVPADPSTRPGGPREF